MDVDAIRKEKTTACLPMLVKRGVVNEHAIPQTIATYEKMKARPGVCSVLVPHTLRQEMVSLCSDDLALDI